MKPHNTTVLTPPPTPPPTDSSSDPHRAVTSVLTRLHTHHPSLRPPSLSDRAKFLEKARQLPGLPEWMWFGMLHYGVSFEDGAERIDFGILDQLLEGGDLEGAVGKQLWGMAFYYMFLWVENGKDRGEKEVEEKREEREVEWRGWWWWIAVGVLGVVVAVVSAFGGRLFVIQVLPRLRWDRVCRDYCRKVVAVVTDNLCYRLGVRPLPGSDG